MPALSRLNIKTDELRMPTTHSEAQNQTKHTFGFKWAKRDTYESESIKRNSKKWLMDRYCGNRPERLEAWLSGAPQIILDAGCGTGGTYIYLKDKGYHNLCGFDISTYAVDICKKRKLNVFHEDIRNIHKHFHENSMDIIICSDILYFLDLEEIKEVLHHFFTILKNNGIVIINLPALKVFRGTHDIVVGIKYRFSKRLIKEIFSSTEFIIREMYYWPFILSTFILLVRSYQKIKMFFKRDLTMTSDLKKYSRIINTVLFGVNKLERQVFKNRGLYGSSLFVSAQKIYN